MNLPCPVWVKVNISLFTIAISPMKGRGSKYSLCLVNYSLSRDYSRLPSYNKTSPIRFLFLPWDVINPFDTLFKEMFSRQVPRQIYFHCSRCPCDPIYSWLPNWFVFLIHIKKTKQGNLLGNPRQMQRCLCFRANFTRSNCIEQNWNWNHFIFVSFLFINFSKLISISSI